MNQLKTFIIIWMAVVASACASSHVLVGTAREAIDPEQVKVYLEPPRAAYETVALLEASDLGANGFSAQSRVNKVMGRLKQEAADLGANGILLQGIGTQYTGSIGTGFANTSFAGNSAYTSGIGFSAAQTSKVGQAIAIYVSDAQESVSQPVLEAATPTPVSTAPTEPAPAPSSNSEVRDRRTLELDPAKRCDACQRIGGDY